MSVRPSSEYDVTLPSASRNVRSRHIAGSGPAIIVVASGPKRSSLSLSANVPVIRLTPPEPETCASSRSSTSVRRTFVRPDLDRRASELDECPLGVRQLDLAVGHEATLVPASTRLRFMSSPAAALASRYEAAAASFVKEHRLPGAAVGVVHDGELAWSGGVGFADRATRRPSDPKTLYRIASITKTFTATAVMQLRDAGKLALDDPAIVYLPELAAAQSPLGPLETLTIRRMLSHESGLQSEPPGTNWSDVLYEDDPNRTLSRASEIALRVPVHTQWKYSNLAYQLLGEIVARVSEYDVPEVHPLEDPSSAGDDGDVARSVGRAAASAPRHRV